MTPDRRNAVIQAYLLWQYEHNSDDPSPEDLLAQGGKTSDGVAITLDELTKCIEQLETLGLIEGHHSFGPQMIQFVNLTADGLWCVTSYGGDLRAWEQQRRAHVDQSVHVTAGRDAQVAAHAQDVTQVQAGGDVNVDQLAKAAELAAEALPALSLPAGVKADVEESIEGVLAEVEKAEPNQEKLKDLGGRLKSGVALAAGAGTIVKLILDGLSGAGVM